MELPAWHKCYNHKDQAKEQTLTNSLKCDEAKSSCCNCQRRKLSCSFLQYIPLPARSQHQQPDRTHQSQTSSTFSRTSSTTAQTSLVTPQSSSLTPGSPTLTKALSSLPLQFSTLDLELLHFYTTTTSHEILGHHMTGTDIWRTVIVTPAFKHPFLLSALFSLSALHLFSLHSSQNKTRSQEYIQIAIKHRLRFISKFRVEIQNLTPENSDACCACALQLALHAWTIPDGQGADLFFPRIKNGKESQVPWYKLHRGGVEVLKSAIYWLKRGELGDLIRPWILIFSKLQPQVLSSTMDYQGADQGKLESIASCWNQEESALCIEDKLTHDETLNALRYVFTLSSLLSSESSFLSEISISSCFATFLWIIIIPPRFCEMVEERCPQALVIVAVYCVLLKRVKELWWIKGKAENLLMAVKRGLSSGEWDEWLKWSVEEVEGAKWLARES